MAISFSRRLQLPAEVSLWSWTLLPTSGWLVQEEVAETVVVPQKAGAEKAGAAAEGKNISNRFEQLWGDDVDTPPALQVSNTVTEPEPTVPCACSVSVWKVADGAVLGA